MNLHEKILKAVRRRIAELQTKLGDEIEKFPPGSEFFLPDHVALDAVRLTLARDLRERSVKIFRTMRRQRRNAEKRDRSATGWDALQVAQYIVFEQVVRIAITEKFGAACRRDVARLQRKAKKISRGSYGHASVAAPRAITAHPDGSGDSQRGNKKRKPM